MSQYQVIAECAHVPVTDHSGVKATHLLYKGAFLPDGVDAERLKFLIDGGFVADTDEAPIAPNAAVEQDPARGLDSVTTEVLAGEKPEEPRRDPALQAGERVAEVVTAEGAVDKAAESPRTASDASAVEAKRAAARARLPEGGAEPDGRASKDVWVEYLAAKGYDYDELVKQEKPDLQKLAKQS
ncbi:hypothetical protein AB0F72_09100 [Actinoplanes sp. NPDC023936]|uniref:hypothetical protein n=1 Tax=Actinoplanes sp. NPDC023936 TaxID=3154910 RepID=UPI0033E99803